MVVNEREREEIIQELKKYSTVVNGTEINSGEIAKEMFFSEEMPKDARAALLGLCISFIKENSDIVAVFTVTVK